VRGDIQKAISFTIELFRESKPLGLGGEFPSFLAFKIDDPVKSKISPPWWEGMMGRGINNFLKFLDSPPSPQPSPVEGEGVFSTFYEIIRIARISKGKEKLNDYSFISFLA